MALLLLAGSGALQPRSADASLFSYRLNGGPFNRYVTIDTGTPIANWYYVRVQLAIRSWNLAQTASGNYVTSFTQTSNWWISSLDYYAYSYGPTQWRGVMVPYQSGGTMVAPAVGAAPTANWDYAELRLNHNYLVDDYNADKPERTESTAAHEFGHGLGLAHNTTSGIPLMNPSITTRYDIYDTFRPRSADIIWADLAY